MPRPSDAELLAWELEDEWESLDEDNLAGCSVYSYMLLSEHEYGVFKAGGGLPRDFTARHEDQS